MTKEIELITNPKLRAKHMNRVEVLDRLGVLQTLPNSYASTTKQIAEYYGVKPQAINGVINLNRNEVQDAGARKAGYDNLKGRLFEVAGSTKAWTEMRYNLGIASGDTNLYPKQAVLLIGFMLEGSVVAMKIRRLVLETSDDLFDDIESPAIIEPTVQKEQYNIQSDELIKTEVNEANEIVVSGRELYEFLEVKTPFHKWIVRMIEYGFVENQDFMVMDIFVPNSKGGKQNQMEYALKLDMAKEISMIQRNDKGKQARQYFIETEKKYKSQAVVPIHSYMIENPIERAKQWIEEQQEKLLLETKVQEQVEVIEHKQNVIVTLTKDVPIAEKRQFLNKVMRRGCRYQSDIISKWNYLYEQFDMKYHVDVKKRKSNFEQTTGKKTSFVEYVENHMSMYDELHELAMKLFENDKEAILKEYESVLVTN